LTSATKGVDQAVFLSIKDAKSGKFKGGRDAVYGLDQKGVGLGKFSPKAPKGLAAKVQKIKAQIIAGKIKNIPTTVKEGAATAVTSASRASGASRPRRRGSPSRMKNNPSRVPT